MPDGLEIGGDAPFRSARVLGGHQLLGVVDDLLHLSIANRAGRLLELPRRITLPVGQRLSAERVELLLELRHAATQLILLLRELTHLFVARLSRRRAIGSLHARSDLTLLTRQLIGLCLRVARRLSGPARLLLLQQLLRFLQPLPGLLRVRVVGAAGRGRLPHRVG